MQLKKVLALVLIFCLLLSAVPVWAANGEPAQSVEETSVVSQTEQSQTTTQEELATPDTSAEVTVVREEESLRGEFEKHFLMSDGTYQAVVYSYPVHELVNGVWVELPIPEQTARGDVSPGNAQQNIIDNYVWQNHGVQDNNSVRLYIGKRSGNECRAFIRFATMPTIPAGATITAATMTVNIVSGTSTAYNAKASQVTGSWESATIQWSNMPTIGSVLENNISHNNKTKYEFSCLAAVRHWYDGSTTGQNENYGIMLQYADSTIADYNSFYSADCTDATMRPSMTIGYTPPNTSKSVIEGGMLTLYLSGVTGVVTWDSDNPLVATVNSNGVVTGIKAGKAVITAYVDGNEYKSFTVYVTLTDGFYYIERGSSRLLVGTEGSIAEHKYVRLTTSTTVQEQQIHQMWHISYLANGFYCIRPLFKPDMALRSENGLPGYVEIATIGINNTATGVPLSSKWTIEFTGTGYAFYYAGATSMAMRSDGGYPLASITTDDYLPGDLAFSWNVTEVEQEISGIYLLNTYTNNIVSERIKKYVIANESTTLGSLNLRAISYSTNVIQNSTEAICPDVIWSVEDPSVAFINGSTGAITGIKTGSTTVVGTLEEDSTQKVMFDIVVIGPEQYAAGVRLTTIGDTQYYDYTIAINHLFEDAVELCEDHRCMNWEQYCVWITDISPVLIPSLSQHTGMQLSSFLWFYEQVNLDAVWDIRLLARWEAAMPNVPYLGEFIFRGEKRTPEDLGNIMYGYTGRATGFGEITLYWGGGVAKQGSASSDLVTQPPLYGDDQNDHDMIAYGFNLFNSDNPDYPEVGYDGIPLDGWIAEIANVILGLGT